MKRNRTTESICIHKIELGINSINNGKRTSEDVGSDLEFFFDKLKEINEPMYNDLFVQYCNARMTIEKLNVSV
jgi:hypothetical protein